jgi:hypothetical protein
MRLVFLCVLLLWSAPGQAQTLSQIRATHHLACGTIADEDDWRAGDR